MKSKNNKEPKFRIFPAFSLKKIKKNKPKGLLLPALAYGRVKASVRVGGSTSVVMPNLSIPRCTVTVSITLHLPNHTIN